MQPDDFETSAARTAESYVPPAPTVLEIANIVASTLYIAGCIAAGLVLHNDGALIFGLATAGINYLATLAQMIAPSWRTTITALVALSIGTGACAGIALLLR
jgi:hypothetical protein